MVGPTRGSLATPAGDAGSQTLVQQGVRPISKSIQFLSGRVFSGRIDDGCCSSFGGTSISLLAGRETSGGHGTHDWGLTQSDHTSLRETRGGLQVRKASRLSLPVPQGQVDGRARVVGTGPWQKCRLCLTYLSPPLLRSGVVDVLELPQSPAGSESKGQGLRPQAGLRRASGHEPTPSGVLGVAGGAGD